MKLELTQSDHDVLLAAVTQIETAVRGETASRVAHRLGSAARDNTPFVRAAMNLAKFVREEIVGE